MAIAYLATVENGSITIRSFHDHVPPSVTLMVGLTEHEAVQNLLNRCRRRIRIAADMQNGCQREIRVIMRHLKRIENDELLACTA